MNTVLRASELLIGLLLLYLRFGLYEPQEGKLQDRLAALWIQIEDYSPTLQLRVSRLLTETARLTLNAFDRSFGPRLVSLRSISTSVVLIHFSTRAVALLLNMAGLMGREPLPWPAHLLLLGSGGLVILTFLQDRKWCRIVILCAAALMVGQLCAQFVLETIRNDYSAPQLGGYVAGYFAMIAVEILWLGVQRYLLRRATSLPESDAKVLHIATLMSLSSLIALAMVGGPLYVRHDVFRPSDVLRWGSGFPGAFLILVTYSRFAAVIISIVQLTILIVLLVQRTLLPLLSRIVYSLERHKVFRERTLFGPIGAALIVDAVGGKAIFEAIKLI